MAILRNSVPFYVPLSPSVLTAYRYVASCRYAPVRKTAYRLTLVVAHHHLAPTGGAGRAVVSDAVQRRHERCVALAPPSSACPRTRMRGCKGGVCECVCVSE
jgi:hypothetical protein